MKRRNLLALLAGTAALSLDGTRRVAAQGRREMRRVAYVTGGSLSTRTEFLAALRRGLGEFGYEEGSNLVLDARGVDGAFDRLPSVIRQSLELHPEVMLVSTTPAVLAAKAATSSVPIVMVGQGDPLGLGIVSNLARPEGNITGITNITVELVGKRLELLKELLPNALRVAVLVNPDDPNALLQMRHASETAQRLRIDLHPVLELRGRGDIEPAFAAARAAGADAVLRMVDPTITLLRAETVRLAARDRIPVMYVFPDDVRTGGLAAYGPELADQYRQAAGFIHKILLGAKPGDLPIEQPTRVVFAINVATALSLGLAVPPSLLARADEVIE